MAVRDIFKVSIKTFFNPAGWIDLESLIAQNRAIWAVLVGLFTVPKPERQETFEEAMQRFGLTEEDVKRGVTIYRLYAFLFLFLGIIGFLYTFYILFKYHTYIGWFLGMAASALFVGQAFRFDFWSFQMSRRQLGATFAEWKRARIGGK